MSLAAATVMLSRFHPVLPPLLHKFCFKGFERKPCLPSCSSTFLTSPFLLDYSYHHHQNRSLNSTLPLLSPRKELLCGLLSVCLLCWQIFVIVKQLIRACPSSQLLLEDNKPWGIIGKTLIQAVQVMLKEL